MNSLIVISFFANIILGFLYYSKISDQNKIDKYREEKHENTIKEALSCWSYFEQNEKLYDNLLKEHGLIYNSEPGSFGYEYMSRHIYNVYKKLFKNENVSDNIDAKKLDRAMKITGIIQEFS